MEEDGGADITCDGGRHRVTTDQNPGLAEGSVRSELGFVDSEEWRESEGAFDESEESFVKLDEPVSKSDLVDFESVTPPAVEEESGSVINHLLTINTSPLPVRIAEREREAEGPLCCEGEGREGMEAVEALLATSSQLSRLKVEVTSARSLLGVSSFGGDDFLLASIRTLWIAHLPTSMVRVG